jgi:hypothetical protein
VQDINTDVIASGVQVKLAGVVATSRKFLFSKGSASGSCIWGVFVSAPGLAEAAPHTGLLLLDYADSAVIGDGGAQAFCPQLGVDPIGDQIPDDTQPGDVLDAIGTVANSIQPQCAADPSATTVPEHQLAQLTTVVKIATAVPPAAHTLTPAELAAIVSQNDALVIGAWAGARIALPGVTSTPQLNGAGVEQITDPFGKMHVHDAALPSPTPADDLGVGEKIYFRPFMLNGNPCAGAPKYDDPKTTFAKMQGVLHLDFCRWDLEPNDKCNELDPPSLDCSLPGCAL